MLKLIKQIAYAFSYEWTALDVQIWQLCHEQPASGVELAMRLNALPGINIKTGTLYPLLHRLEKFGYLKVAESVVDLEPRGGAIRYRYSGIGSQPVVGVVAKPFRADD